MYKCIDCGHIFDDGEQAVSREYHTEIPGGFHEDIAKCPICGGDFEETVECKKCRGEFLPDELIGGYYCEECLKAALTVDSFLDFADYADENLGDSDLHTVEHFMLVWVYGVSDSAITGSSKDFRALMTEEFEETVRAAVYVSNDHFLENLWNYLHDYDMLGSFAEWLYDKEVNK